MPAQKLRLPRPGRAFLIVLGLAALHAIAVWRYGGLIWGDHGRWLFNVSRFAAGEAPYRDFAFPNPPVGLILVGTLSRIVGTSFGAISAITTLLFLATFAVFVLALRRLLPDVVLPIAVPALLFSVALACRHGVTLPAGTDAVSGPVGFLCLQLGAWLMLETVEQPRVRRAAASGAFFALAMMSKHDFWPPTILLLVAAVVVLVRYRAPRRVIVAGGAGFAIAGAAILGGMVVWVGAHPVYHMLTGSGHAVEIALRSTPSLERMVAETAASAALVLTAVTALWLCLAISDRTASRWAGAMILTFLTAAAVHLGMSVAIGRDVLLTGRPAYPNLTQFAFVAGFEVGRSVFAIALDFFDDRLLTHLLPTILPPVLLVVLVARWRRWQDPRLRGRAVVLMALAVAARTRRGFVGGDWYNVLLELPAYAVFIQLICGDAKQKAARAVRATLAVFIALGAYSYINLANGPLTFNGVRPRVMTRQGRARWARDQARAYHYTDSVLTALDRSGTRPVYALGPSAGWNYFLKRPNPLPFTEGLPSDLEPAQLRAATERLLAARPLLIENRLALRRVMGRPSLLAWEPGMEAARYERRDAPWFATVTAHCRAADPTLDSTATIRIWDCDQATR